MEISLAAQRRQIRTWSVVLGVLMVMFIAVYVYGRTQGISRLVSVRHHRHASLSEAAVIWLGFVGVGLAAAAAGIRRRNLVQRYNAQLLAEDPMLRGDRAPLLR